MKMRALTRFMLMLLLVTGAAASNLEKPESDPAPPCPAPLHEDGEELEAAALEVTRAFLRDDGETALRWLETMERNCRRLHREKDAAFGAKIVDYDQTFHLTVDRVREIIRATGNMERAFDQYKWTQKSCIDCHALARERGLLTRAE
jgi:hypothetical protein